MRFSQVPALVRAVSHLLNRTVMRLPLGVGCLSLGLTAIATTPSVAAESLVIKVGPLRQAIALADLETFAQTGTVPDSLKLYERFLSPSVQQALLQQLALDPRMSDRIIEDVIGSANGELLLDTLSRVAPDLTITQLQGAIRLAASQADGLSVLGILRAIPQDTLEVDLSAAISLVSQLNLSNLESRTLSGVLEQELLIESAVALPTDLDPAALGPSNVSRRSVAFEDESRDRIIPVALYWSQDTRGPLIVLSHGFGADRFFLNYLGEHLASHGYTVASVEHPGSNVEALLSLPADPNIASEPSRLLPATEFLDRPRDVSFVLDRLAEISDRPDSRYSNLFNTEDVTIIGHSLGGYTGLALAGAKLDLRSLQSFCQNIQPLGVSPADWLQCAAVDLEEQTADLSDNRITRVMAMNPLTGQLFGEAGLSAVSVPTLLLTGTADSVTPTLDQQLSPFTQLTGEKYLLAVIGGTHLSVGDPTNVNPALTELPFMSELRGDETANLRELLKGVSLSFVEQTGDRAETYAPFLSAAYAQSWSTGSLPLRLTQSLPSSVESWLTFTNRILVDENAHKLSHRLTVLGYLNALDNRQQLQKTAAVHLQASHVVTMLRSPLSLFF